MGFVCPLDRPGLVWYSGHVAIERQCFVKGKTVVGKKATVVDAGEFTDIPDEFFDVPDVAAEEPQVSVPDIGYTREPRTLRENHHGKINAVGKTPAYFFKDVLDMAYAGGLVSLQTESVEILAGIAVVHVSATFQNADGTFSHFRGIGDASPSNVGSMVAPHYIRMAETRAQARVLSRALNLNAVTAEELNRDEGDSVPNASAAPSYAQRPSQPVANSNGGSFKKEITPDEFPPTNSQNASGFECEKCGKMIPGKTAYWSVKKKGRYLCFDHQNES
jgi:hypothetical protein